MRKKQEIGMKHRCIKIPGPGYVTLVIDSAGRALYGPFDANLDIRSVVQKHLTDLRDSINICEEWLALDAKRGI